MSRRPLQRHDSIRRSPCRAESIMSPKTFDYQAKNGKKCSGGGVNPRINYNTLCHFHVNGASRNGNRDASLYAETFLFTVLVTRQISSTNRRRWKSKQERETPLLFLTWATWTPSRSLQSDATKSESSVRKNRAWIGYIHAH